MAAKKKRYLYAVQRPSGHEVLAATVEGATPVVEAQHMANGLVRLVRDGQIVGESDQVLEDPDEELTLYRWDADDKLAEPQQSSVVPKVGENREPPLPVECQGRFCLWAQSVGSLRPSSVPGAGATSGLSPVPSAETTTAAGSPSGGAAGPVTTSPLIVS
jgi:hypothetical protein